MTFLVLIVYLFKSLYVQALWDFLVFMNQRKTINHIGGSERDYIRHKHGSINLLIPEYTKVQHHKRPLAEQTARLPVHQVEYKESVCAGSCSWYTVNRWDRLSTTRSCMMEYLYTGNTKRSVIKWMESTFWVLWLFSFSHLPLWCQQTLSPYSDFTVIVCDWWSLWDKPYASACSYKTAACSPACLYGEHGTNSSAPNQSVLLINVN